MNARPWTLGVDEAAPALPAFLDENPRLGKIFPAPGLLLVFGGASREGRWGSDGACLEWPSESSEDPIGLAGGDPNFYRYCEDSPTNATDPAGLDPSSSPVSVGSLSITTGPMTSPGYGMATNAIAYLQNQYSGSVFYGASGLGGAFNALNGAAAKISYYVGGTNIQQPGGFAGGTLSIYGTPYALTMAHELVHALDWLNGWNLGSYWSNPSQAEGLAYGFEEALHIANMLKNVDLCMDAGRDCATIQQKWNMAWSEAAKDISGKLGTAVEVTYRGGLLDLYRNVPRGLDANDMVQVSKLLGVSFSASALAAKYNDAMKAAGICCTVSAPPNLPDILK